MPNIYHEFSIKAILRRYSNFEWQWLLNYQPTILSENISNHNLPGVWVLVSHEIIFLACKCMCQILWDYKFQWNMLKTVMLKTVYSWDGSLENNCFFTFSQKKVIFKKKFVITVLGTISHGNRKVNVAVNFLEKIKRKKAYFTK